MKDAIILVLANKQDLPFGRHILVPFEILVSW